MIGIWLPLIMYRNSYENYRMVISNLTYDDLEMHKMHKKHKIALAAMSYWTIGPLVVYRFAIKTH